MEIDKELNIVVEQARDYYNISFVLSKTSKDNALESLYNALRKLQEFEKYNNYHHPFMDKVNDRISDLKEAE